jgi:formylglycine-generating enzyme required for sulfatase activity
MLANTVYRPWLMGLAALLLAGSTLAASPSKLIIDCDICPELIAIPAGTFSMGSNDLNNEKPLHSVSIQRFALGKYEVTQGQWKAVMGSSPSYFTNCGDTCPVENVSWNVIQQYIQKLNAMSGKQFRLPSEAEWEYACRAGGSHKYCGSDDRDAVAWYGAYASPVGTSAKTTNPVGTREANAFGLYDMSGNVWEWVQDYYHDSYSGAPSDGSAWESGGAQKFRVLRGGSWFDDPAVLRSASRFWVIPGFRYNFIGFRLARTLLTP